MYWKVEINSRYTAMNRLIRKYILYKYTTLHYRQNIFCVSIDSIFRSKLCIRNKQVLSNIGINLGRIY